MTGGGGGEIRASWERKDVTENDVAGRMELSHSIYTAHGRLESLLLSSHLYPLDYYSYNPFGKHPMTTYGLSTRMKFHASETVRKTKNLLVTLELEYSIDCQIQEQVGTSKDFDRTPRADLGYFIESK